MCGGFVGDVLDKWGFVEKPQTYNAQAEAAKAAAESTKQINEQKAQRKKRAASTVLASTSENTGQAKTTLGG